MSNGAGAVRDFYVEHDPVYADPVIMFEGKPMDMYSRGLTRQEFREECDINTIMAKYEVTGQLPQNLNASEPVYFDTAALPPDLMSALQYVKDAEKAFMMLPASVRKEFDNDAVRWCDYASDPANLEQMRKWGLAPPVPDAPPAPVEPPPSA